MPFEMVNDGSAKNVLWVVGKLNIILAVQETLSFIRLVVNSEETGSKRSNREACYAEN